jgi:RimJ/RimL family protein N-acetyltransferase
MANDALIKGKTIFLRPFSEQDIKIKVLWLNDPEIKNNLILKDEINLQTTLEWFKSSQNDPTRKDFIIETNDGKVIGTIGLRKISIQERSSCIYIIIGDKEYWGKGIMFESERILIEWAFNEMEVEKIWADVRYSNIASIITMKKIGFKPDFDSNKRDDVLRFTLSKKDFNNIKR